VERPVSLELLVDIDETRKFAALTLNRPASLNALTAALLDELLATFQTVAREERVRAILLTGAGKAFCAGQALDDDATLRPDGTADLRGTIERRYAPLVLALRAIEKPIVAAVNGVAAGAGMGLALACDLRVAATSATFTTAFAKIGLVADSGLSHFLPRFVGFAKALELALLSERVSSTEALRLGLVTRVVPDDELLAHAQELTATLAAGPRALGLMKAQFARASQGELERALRDEAAAQEQAGATRDFAEGVRAFTQKRAPVFEGH
jgi:2-(1,2-epoxy-1,2-dihydrophenyl)acetyl-CoA isomerase